MAKEEEMIGPQTKRQAAQLAKMIQQQDASIGVQEATTLQFDQETEQIALSRLRLCLAIFALLFPLLSFIDYQTRGFQNPTFSLAIRGVLELILCIYAGLTFIPQFKKNVYFFTFLLILFIGIYNLLVLVFEGRAAMENYVVYAIVFSIIGVLMPWGGKAVAGICIPGYLFYPLGMMIGRVEVTGNFFLKSNIYLILFVLIVIVGASLNARFRFQEFLLKKRMEEVNRVLEDYQTRLKRSYQRLENMAIIDRLTGVYNRTYLTQWLTREVYKKKGAFDVFSILMYDLDQFKEVNDLAGHQMGDRLLQRLTEIIQENLDINAPIFRYGGDEFCVILPGVDLRGAVRAAENLRRIVESSSDLEVKYSPTDSIHVTISLGVITEFVSGTIDADYLIKWVDAALLESKRQGRNCIHVFDSDDRKIRSAERWLETPS